jgi:hypothetical protein
MSALCLLSADPQRGSIQQVHSVYLLPMSNALDQYLANRLTVTGLFQVVTDPQKADALFTDTIGEGLEQKFAELYPETQPEKDENDSDKTFDKPAKRFGSFGRGRGTLFLIDRNSRAVLWSTYWPVRGTRPDDTNHRAQDIIKRLEKDLKGK